MIDAGAIFRMRGANLDVGTSAEGIDESAGALQVRPGDRHRERPLGRLDRQPAVGRERDRVLADLVALGQVRVEVVLARKNALWRNVGAESQS